MSPLGRRLRWASPCALWLAMSGCGVDLLVGGNGSSTGAGSETGGEAGEVTTTSVNTDDGADSTSTGSQTTGGATSEPSGTSTGPEEGTTSTGPMEEEGSTGDLPCEGQNVEVCNELPYCLWYPDSEECGPNPCEQEPPHECFDIVAFKMCVDVPVCAWAGEPEMGECAPLECVPCEFLELEQCMEAPLCVWEEMKAFCGDLPR